MRGGENQIPSAYGKYKKYSVVLPVKMELTWVAGPNLPVAHLW